jgi:hypothetical protein
MKRLFVLAASFAAACATVNPGPQMQRTIATARVDPSERDRAVTSALRVAQQKGWLIAVSDRSAGLLTSQNMSTGTKPCGTLACESRSTLQITVADSGDVVVNLHREFLNPISHAWFVPTLARDVKPIEAEQLALLNAIVGSPPPVAR